MLPSYPHKVLNRVYLLCPAMAYASELTEVTRKYDAIVLLRLAYM